MNIRGRHVLVADDEVDVLNLVSQNLTAAGFEVSKAADGIEALEKVRRNHPLLVVLDLNMPKMNGTDVLRALKSDERTAGVAVVMLTACKDDVDRIVSLELGADDYVTKPFSPRELILRIKAILARQGGPASTPTMTMVGDIALNREAHEVKVRNKTTDLTVVEYKLLVALFSHPGRVFSREELLTLVWGRDSEIELRTVDTHLRRLRDKLGIAARQVLTVRGFGYRLDAA